MFNKGASSGLLSTRGSQVLALSLLLLTVCILLEYRYNYFFLNDDNRTYALPAFMHNWEALSEGAVPLYNFHQFLGTPHLALSQPASLYPPGYLASLLSQLAFGHGYAVIDILVVAHLLLGGVGFYILTRHMGLGGSGAFFGGLTWPLASFSIYGSDSWWCISAVVAYLPWMVVFAMRLYDGMGGPAFAPLVLARSLLFYSGYAQYFVYACIFEFLTVSLLVAPSLLKPNRRPHLLRFLELYIASYVVLLFVSLPLLLPTWHQMDISEDRNQPLPYNAFLRRIFPTNVWLPGLLFQSVNAYGTYNENLISYLVFIGYLTLLSILYSAWALTRNNDKRNPLHAHIVTYGILAVFSFTWSASKAFQSFLYLLPILNRFRWPFKVYLFTDFYLVLLAAIGFHLLAVSLRNYRNAIPAALILIQASSMSYVYLSSPHYTFIEHGCAGGRYCPAQLRYGEDLFSTDKLAGELVDGGYSPYLTLGGTCPPTSATTMRPSGGFTSSPATTP